jgi:hypothetical protein
MRSAMSTHRTGHHARPAATTPSDRRRRVQWGQGIMRVALLVLVAYLIVSLVAGGGVLWQF